MVDEFQVSKEENAMKHNNDTYYTIPEFNTTIDKELLNMFINDFKSGYGEGF